jgi:hypothetical protein
MLNEEDTGSDSLLNGNPEESDFEALYAQLDTNGNSTSISWADMMEEADSQQEQCHPQATAKLEIRSTNPLHHRPESRSSMSRIDERPSGAEETDIAVRQMSRLSSDPYDPCEDSTLSIYDKSSLTKKELELTEAILLNQLFHKILRKEVSGSTPLRELVLIKSMIKKIKDGRYIPNIYTTEEMLTSHEKYVTCYIRRNLRVG